MPNNKVTTDGIHHKIATEFDKGIEHSNKPGSLNAVKQRLGLTVSGYGTPLGVTHTVNNWFESVPELVDEAQEFSSSSLTQAKHQHIEHNQDPKLVQANPRRRVVVTDELVKLIDNNGNGHHDTSPIISSSSSSPELISVRVTSSASGSRLKREQSRPTTIVSDESGSSIVVFEPWAIELVVREEELNARYEKILIRRSNDAAGKFVSGFRFILLAVESIQAAITNGLDTDIKTPISFCVDGEASARALKSYYSALRSQLQVVSRVVPDDLALYCNLGLAVFIVEYLKGLGNQFLDVNNNPLGVMIPFDVRTQYTELLAQTTQIIKEITTYIHRPRAQQGTGIDITPDIIDSAPQQIAQAILAEFKPKLVGYCEWAGSLIWNSKPQQQKTAEKCTQAFYDIIQISQRHGNKMAQFHISHTNDYFNNKYANNVEFARRGQTPPLYIHGALYNWSLGLFIAITLILVTVYYLLGGLPASLQTFALFENDPTRPTPPAQDATTSEAILGWILAICGSLVNDGVGLVSLIVLVPLLSLLRKFIIGGVAGVGATLVNTFIAGVTLADQPIKKALATSAAIGGGTVNFYGTIGMERDFRAWLAEKDLLVGRHVEILDQAQNRIYSWITDKSEKITDGCITDEDIQALIGNGADTPVIELLLAICAYKEHRPHHRFFTNQELGQRVYNAISYAVSASNIFNAEGGLLGFLYSTYISVSKVVAKVMQGALNWLINPAFTALGMSSLIILSYKGAQNATPLMIDWIFLTERLKSYAYARSPKVFLLLFSLLFGVGLGSYGNTYTTYAAFLVFLHVTSVGVYWFAFAQSLYSALMFNVFLAVILIERAIQYGTWGLAKLRAEYGSYCGRFPCTPAEQEIARTELAMINILWLLEDLLAELRQLNEPEAVRQYWSGVEQRGERNRIELIEDTLEQSKAWPQSNSPVVFPMAQAIVRNNQGYARGDVESGDIQAEKQKLLDNTRRVDAIVLAR